MRRTHRPAPWLIASRPYAVRASGARARRAEDQIVPAAPGAAAAPEQPPWRRSPLFVLVESFSLTTAACFLLASFVNELVFERWGLSFVQLATLSDVLMSGLSVLLWVAPAVLLVVGFYLLGRARGRVLRIAWWLALVPSAAFALLGLLTLVTRSADAALLAATGSMLVAALLLPRAMRIHPSRRQARLVLFGGLLVLLTGSILQVVGFAVYRYQMDGYYEDYALRLVHPVIAGCPGEVLWNGDRAVVLDCDPAVGRRRIQVVLGQEDWIFARAPVSRWDQRRERFKASK